MEHLKYFYDKITFQMTILNLRFLEMEHFKRSNFKNDIFYLNSRAKWNFCEVSNKKMKFYLESLTKIANFT